MLQYISIIFAEVILNVISNMNVLEQDWIIFYVEFLLKRLSIKTIK